jgi:hypothetical protein
VKPSPTSILTRQLNELFAIKQPSPTAGEIFPNARKSLRKLLGEDQRGSPLVTRLSDFTQDAARL